MNLTLQLVYIDDVEIQNKVRSWKAQALWSKFDKRASHKCYNHGKNCNDTKVGLNYIHSKDINNSHCLNRF